MFNHVWQLYQFDRELRLLVIDAIEKIEVAFRAALVNVTSIRYDPFWYVDRQFFKREDNYQIVLKNVNTIVKDKQELFIKHFFQKYSSPNYPPIWMTLEALSFGVCSKLFSNIKAVSVRNEIAHNLGQHTTILESWLRTLSYTRNLCAHHNRLWNRWFVNPPILPKHDTYRHHFYTTGNFRFHLIAYVLQRFLEKIAPESCWREKLFHLFEKYPLYPGKDMGFDANWRSDLFWDI